MMTMSFSLFFHRLAGWKLVMTVPLRKEIYLVYLFKKCTVFKKKKHKKTREALLFLDTKQYVTFKGYCGNR